MCNGVPRCVNYNLKQDNKDKFMCTCTSINFSVCLFVIVGQMFLKETQTMSFLDPTQTIDLTKEKNVRCLDICSVRLSVFKFHVVIHFQRSPIM